MCFSLLLSLIPLPTILVHTSRVGKCIIGEIMLSKVLSFLVSMMFVVGVAVAHHNAPEDLQDAITDILLSVDSPHATTSEDDPSLLDGITVDTLVFLGLEDVDYIAVIPDISLVEVQALVDQILQDAAINNSVCDSAFTITMEDDGTYTLTVYVDYCDT